MHLLWQFQRYTYFKIIRHYIHRMKQNYSYFTLLLFIQKYLFCYPIWILLQVAGVVVLGWQFTAHENRLLDLGIKQKISTSHFMDQIMMYFAHAQMQSDHQRLISRQCWVRLPSNAQMQSNRKNVILVFGHRMLNKSLQCDHIRS